MIDFSKVPGPSPWFYPEDAHLEFGGRAYSWTHSSGKDAGFTFLIDDEGKTVLILDFQCYFMKIDSEKALVWHDDWKSKDKKLVFKILNIPSLDRFDDPLVSMLDIRKDGVFSGIASERDSSAEAEIPHAAEGPHSISVPEEFSCLGEILALADFIPAGGNAEASGKPHAAIYAVNFSESKMDVYPQVWFNEGEMDFGYQWITHVARNHDGTICGSGIRIGTFTLDSSFTKLARE